MASIYKFSFVVLMALLFAAQPVLAQHQKHGLTWYNDINKVYEVAQKTKKPVFAFFTGSDWCGWCHKLEAAVFVKPGFQKWAKENVILMELDFPRKKQLPLAIQQQNESLQNFLQVQGFPTIWVFNISKDSTTNNFSLDPYGSLGYPRSAPGQEEATFLQNIKDIINKKKQS